MPPRTTEPVHCPRQRFIVESWSRTECGLAWTPMIKTASAQGRVTCAKCKEVRAARIEKAQKERKAAA
jgi:hypothetical protein